jgi:hypothetical protein
MIIIKLKGGLGNQMFQYALGRKLSLKTGKEFKLNKIDYERDTFRSYGLGVFNIIENFANDDEISKIDPSRRKNSIFFRLKKIIEFRVLKNYHVGWEPHFFKKTLNKIRGEDVYLDGYWQSYKYFEDIRETIIEDFSLKIGLEQSHLDLLNQINSGNSVSLAVRRTDYLNPEMLRDFGICSARYYNEAISLIEEKIKEPKFFVVSDDLDWTKANINFKNHHVVYISELRENDKIKDYQEMSLMSKCKHNIIANSSFSWWPAWLNSNPDKIVIAPDIWSNNRSSKINELVPKNWVKIKRN